MTLTLETPAPLVTGPKYYQSFASYEIPFRPIRQVSFADTEGLAAYSVAYHDQAGRVRRFDKLRLIRQAKEPVTLALPTPMEPGDEVYFASVADPQGGGPIPGEQLEFPVTRELDEFFAGAVGQSGKDCQITRLRREITFTETYTYWPNGRMRTRSKIRPNREREREYYDEAGNRLQEEVIPFSWKMHFGQGLARLMEGDFATAQAAAEAALRASQSEGSLHGIASTLILLARVDLANHRLADAIDKCRQSMPIWPAVADGNGEANAWCTFGAIEQAEGKQAKDQGRLDEAEHHYDAARGCFENAVRLARRYGNQGNEVDALEALGRLASERHEDSLGALDSTEANTGSVFSEKGSLRE